jgi:GNAT superfamily N-acetyltransferase
MLPPNYHLKITINRELHWLQKFMRQCYQELCPNQNSFAHLNVTVVQYYSPETPTWWVLTDKPIACLWLGNAYDQITGNRYAQVLLLYVEKKHRRQGIAKTLLQQAQTWATARGDSQIGLYSFAANNPALKLYQNQGYQTQSLFMVKKLDNE